MLSEAIEIMGWTLLHFVWQGFAAAVLLAALLLMLRRATAHARYLAACIVFGLMAFAPLITSWWLSEQTRDSGTEISTDLRRVGRVSETHPASATDVVGLTDSTHPTDEPTDIGRATPDIVADAASVGSRTQAASVTVIAAGPSWLERIRQLAERHLGVIVGVWLFVVAILSLRLLAGWLSVQRLRRRAHQPANESWQAMLSRLAERLRVTRPVQLVESALVEVPTVIGWLKPIILLPASAMTGLTTEQLEALLAHELAHVRRHDYLVNLLQTVVETLLFYHPAVWWVSHRIRLEREHCCDDLAVQVCGDGLTYAKALVALEELRGPKLGLAMSSRGGSLLTRVARLLDQAEQQRRPTGWIAGLLSLVLLTMAGALGAGLLTPPDNPTEGLPNDRQPTTTKSDTNEETSGPYQRRGQETRAESEETEAEWGQEQNGLRARLTLLSEDPVVGRLVIKIEIENVGATERTWRWHPREVARYVRIIGPDGKDAEDLTEVARSLMGRPTVVRPTQIKPGETTVLLEFYDLAGRFLLAKPGQYEIRFGRAADGELAGKFKNDGDDIVPIPESSRLKFQLGEGELPEIQSLALRLRKVLPAEWRVGLPDPDEFQSASVDSADVGVLFDRSKKSGPLVLGFFRAGRSLPKFDEKTEITLVDLGPTKLGRAYLAALMPDKTPWLAYADQIRAQLPQEQDNADASKSGTVSLPNPVVPTRKSADNLGRFVGRVRLKTEKALPDLEKVEVPAGKVLDESLVFSKDGGLANVFVYLRKPTFAIEPTTEAELAKPFVLIAEDGRFWPHAAFVRVGRPVVLENGVAEPINFYTQPLHNNPLNVLVKAQDRFKAPAFQKSEPFPYPVKSNIKPWMLAHLLPLDHPFAAVTDEDGRFAINGLPAGEHELRVWHERVGYLEKSLVITIKAGEETSKELEYTPDRLKLTEAEVLAWVNRLIDTKWIPRLKVPRPAVPQPEEKKQDKGGDLRSDQAAGLEDPRRAQNDDLKSQISTPKSDAEKLAIERGIAFLKAQQQDDGGWRDQLSQIYPGAVTSLCTAALLQAGVKPDDTGIQKAIASSRKIEPLRTYSVALQTMVFCAATPKEDAELIRRNVAWLEKAQVADGKTRGAWSYGLNDGGRGDGSCSRFGTLGLHAAKKAGFDVQAETWQRVSDYYLRSQTTEGGWSYNPQGHPSLSMTLAGVGSLATANRYLPQDDQTKARETAIHESAKYLEKRFPSNQRCRPRSMRFTASNERDTSVASLSSASSTGKPTRRNGCWTYKVRTAVGPEREPVRTTNSSPPAWHCSRSLVSRSRNQTSLSSDLT